MPATSTRRPLPALAFLLALSVLTAIVWWRVLHRDNSSAATSAPPAPVPTCASAGNAVVLPKPAKVSVTVYNAAGKDGLAAAVSSQLTKDGFAMKSPQTASNQLSSVGEIHYGRAGKSGATLLGLYVPGSKLVLVSRSDAGVDLYLGSGYRTLASASTAKAAEAKLAKPCGNH
jgi:hypothetical protein